MLQDIRECNIKLYRNGTAVAYVQPVGRKREDLEKITKPTRVYRKRRRNIVSAAINLWDNKKKLLMFITYTFAQDMEEKPAAIIFTNFLKNLVTNYGINAYVWVKERQKNGRLHYHAIIDGPWINPKVMQRSFNCSVANYDRSFSISSNSVRYGYHTIVKNVRSLSRYVSKYAGKDTGDEFTRPCYSYTNNVSEIARQIDFEELEAIANLYGKWKIIELDFALVVLTNYIDTKECKKNIGKYLENCEIKT